MKMHLKMACEGVDLSWLKTGSRGRNPVNTAMILRCSIKGEHFPELPVYALWATRNLILYKNVCTVEVEQLSERSNTLWGQSKVYICNIF
jgi:hypothetical protein